MSDDAAAPPLTSYMEARQEEGDSGVSNGEYGQQNSHSGRVPPPLGGGSEGEVMPPPARGEGGGGKPFKVPGAEIFVGGLPPALQKPEFESFFEQFGAIARCDLKEGTMSPIAGFPFVILG